MAEYSASEKNDVPRLHANSKAKVGQIQ
jgi:hypothetical protein